MGDDGLLYSGSERTIVGQNGNLFACGGQFVWIDGINGLHLSCNGKDSLYVVQGSRWDGCSVVPKLLVLEGGGNASDENGADGKGDSVYG